jgi:hypothetical protein
MSKYVPQYYKQESSKGFILHSHCPDIEGIQACAESDFNAMMIPKIVGRWTNNKQAWRRALKHAFITSMPSLVTIFEHGETNEALKNIDIEDLLHNRIGIPVEVDTFEKLFDMVQKANRSEHDEITKVTAMLIKATTYACAISMEMSKKGTCDLNSLEQIVAKNGYGYPRWSGNTKFFGWDGTIESLQQIEQNQDMHEFNHVACAMHYNGFAEDSNEDYQGGSSVIAVLSDTWHRNYREMNWHLDDDVFAQHPYSSENGDKIDPYLHMSDDAYWIGSKNLQYLKEEGMQCISQFGAAVILNNDFSKFNEALAENCGMYDAEDPESPLIWIDALSKNCAKTISRFGVTSASIIEELSSGFYISPSCLYIDCKNDREFATNIMSRSPLHLDLVFSVDSLEAVSNKGEQRDAFIKYIQRCHLPNSTIDTVEREVDKAIVKLAVVNEKAKSYRLDEEVDNNFAEAISEFCSDQKKDFVDLLKVIDDIDDELQKKEA